MARPTPRAVSNGPCRELRQRLEREGKIQPGLTVHGLRHTAGNVLADLGADPKTIAAMLGQVSEAAAGHYSGGTDRRPEGLETRSAP